MNFDARTNIEFYEDLWMVDWIDMERFNPTARHLKRIIVALIRGAMPVESLLDAGCGMGVNVRDLRRKFPHLRITGTDLSERILGLAREYVGPDPMIEFASLDLGQASLDRQFDLILCNQVLEHVEDDRRAIRNLAQMTRRWLLITVPGGAYNSTSKLVGHFRHYSRNDICRKVEEAGLKVVFQREWGFPFHSIYKWALGSMPIARQKAIGLGKYTFLKRRLSDLVYLAFCANVFDKGANVIVLAEKSA
jgi:SAM-dependent methyltransferase